MSSAPSVVPTTSTSAPETVDPFSTIKVPDNVQAPPYVKKFINEKMKHLPTVKNDQGNLQLSKANVDKAQFPDFILYPPNPTIHSASRARPQPEDFYLWNVPVAFWLPHIFWFDYIGRSLKCPECKRPRTWRTKGIHGPRLVRTLTGTLWLCSGNLLCDKNKRVRDQNGVELYRGCGHQWLSTNERFLETLPLFIKEQFKVHLSARSAVTTEVRT